MMVPPNCLTVVQAFSTGVWVAVHPGVTIKKNAAQQRYRGFMCLSGNSRLVNPTGTLLSARPTVVLLGSTIY